MLPFCTPLPLTRHEHARNEVCGLTVRHRAVRVPEVALRGKGSRGCCVTGLIAGLFGLVFVGGLLMFIRGRRRPSADDTLVTDLLGPPDGPAPSTPGRPAPSTQAREEGRQPSPAARKRRRGTPSPAARAREEGQLSPAARAWEERQPSPAARAREEGQPSPAARAREEDEPSPAPRAGEGDWLEAQLAWINAWSQRMSQQITSTERPEPHGKE